MSRSTLRLPHAVRCFSCDNETRKSFVQHTVVSYEVFFFVRYINQPAPTGRKLLVNIVTNKQHTSSSRMEERTLILIASHRIRSMHVCWAVEHTVRIMKNISKSPREMTMTWENSLKESHKISLLADELFIVTCVDSPALSTSSLRLDVAAQDYYHSIFSPQRSWTRLDLESEFTIGNLENHCRWFEINETTSCWLDEIWRITVIVFSFLFSCGVTRWVKSVVCIESWRGECSQLRRDVVLHWRW